MSPFGKLFQGFKSLRDLPARALAIGQGKAAIVALLTLLSLSTPGCSVMHNGFGALTKNNSWNDTVVVLRNRSYSAKAWHRRKQNFCTERHNQDFCNGFRAGYEAVCTGSNGCTPAYPPNEYWSWEYQSGEGQARTSAWFTGYPHGVRAAEEEGASNWHQIQFSPDMNNQLQNTAALNQPMGGYPYSAAQPQGGVAGPAGMIGSPQAAPMMQPEMFGPELSIPSGGLPSSRAVPRVQ